MRDSTFPIDFRTINRKKTQLDHIFPNPPKYSVVGIQNDLNTKVSRAPPTRPCSNTSSVIMTTASNDILSWTNQDPRESTLFNSWGVLYRFQTSVSASSQSVTTLWRTIRPNKEDRVAKLEWATNGGLGRVIIGKNTLPMADLVIPDPNQIGMRFFTGPDGLAYRWRPSSTNQDILLQDATGAVIAFFRPTRPTRYQIGDVYGELHFVRAAGMGTVTHPPIMDAVVVTIMLYRFCAQWNL